MSSNRFDRLETLFAAACEVPAENRSAFLDERCGDDRDLRSDVEELLARDAEVAGSSVELGIELGIAREAASALAEPADTPDRIGPYRISGLLGSGGMGVVYRAEQESPRRTIALKVIRPGLVGEKALRRFEFEAQVLGLLQHPGIAQIYEAGTAEPAGGSGPIPYFAMELVEGRAIDEYVTEANLSTHDRLELLARVCDAVHHAHQKGVIHRDLKPGNILVPTSADPIGRPKVLDFGVARAAEADPRTTTFRTAEGQLVGTLPYMSPEQVSGTPEVLDTRSDVYSLGVVLYELLTGNLPIDVGTRPLADAARMIAEQEPTRISSSDARFRGDIETIVQKSLEKDPDRRYGSAAELAADLRRHLRDEPISARPASRIYQLRKFARRNRAIVLGIAAVFVVLVVGIVAERRQRIRAEDERLRAETERTNAVVAKTAALDALDGSERVTSFLTELLGSANPGSPEGRDVTVLEKLREADGRLEEEFAGQPLIQARIRYTIADTFLALGEYRSAADEYARSIELRLPEHGEDHINVLFARVGRANALCELGEFDEALEIAEGALERLRALFGPKSQESFSALSLVAAIHNRLGHEEIAFELLEVHLELALEHLGQDSPFVLNSWNNIAMHYVQLDRPDDAEPILRRILEIRLEIRGEDHQETLLSLNNLGHFLNTQKRYDEAIPYLEAAVVGAQSVLGAEHARTVAYGNNLGVSFYANKRFEEALPYFETAVAVSEKNLGPESPQTLGARGNLAGLRRKIGQLDVALEEYPKIVAGYRRAFPVGHPQIGHILRLHGLCLIDGELFEEAEKLLLESRGILEALGPTHRMNTMIGESLVQLYEKWGKPEEAKQWREAVTVD